MFLRYLPPPVSASLRPLAVATMLAMAACAQLPKEMGPTPEIRGAEHWSAETSFQDQAKAWPDDQWWRAYGDVQLNALIDEALREAPSLRIAQARLQSAQAAVSQTHAATGPQLSANGTVYEEKQSYHFMPKELTPMGWNDYGRLSLDFNWEIDFWGKNRAALAAAMSERDAAIAEQAQARLILAANVASTYAEMARQYAERDTAEEALQVRRKTSTLFHERYDNGMETMGSVKQADARQFTAEGQLLAIDEQLGLLRNRLAALIGAGPDRGAKIERPTIHLSDAPGLPAQLSAGLLGRRPDIVAARLRAQSAIKRMDVAKAQYYPNVNLSGLIGVQSAGLDYLFKSGQDIGRVGPAISLPIFSNGRLDAQYRGSRAAYDEAVASYEGAVTQALNEVADATTSRRALGAELERAQATVDAAREAWQIAKNRYEGGLANYLEVLNAEDILLVSQRSLTDLQSRAFTLDVALIRALGGGYQSAPSNPTIASAQGK
jgi:NodT family efflux transporter outer membrane factor (OMF) lipoprotein